MHYSISMIKINYTYLFYHLVDKLQYILYYIMSPSSLHKQVNRVF